MIIFAINIPKSNRHKLDPCATKCVFVGYGIHQKGYRYFDPVTSQMHTTMNCDFLETEFYFKPTLSGQGENHTLDPLRWLISPVLLEEPVSTEQVGGLTEPASENMGQNSSEKSPEVSSSSDNSEVSTTPGLPLENECSNPIVSTSTDQLQGRYSLSH